MSQKPNNKEDLINALVVKLADTSTLSVKELKDMLTDELYDYSLTLIESTELISVNGSMTDYLFNYFYIGKLSANVQENSLNNYRLTVYQLVNLLGKELNEITSDDIRVFLIRYKQIKGCCDVTMNKKRLVLSSVFGYLYNTGKIPTNPMATIEPIKVELKLKVPLTDEEVEKIKMACEIEKNAKKGRRDLALVNFFLDTGVRVSEGISINIEDIDWDNKKVKIMGKGRKERYVYFSDRTKLRLLAYFKDRDDIWDNNTNNFKMTIPIETPLFAQMRGCSKRLSKSGVENIMRELREPSGVARLHPHLLRATFATNLFRRGADIKVVAQALGHANMNTVNRYCVVEEEELGNMIRKSL